MSDVFWLTDAQMERLTPFFPLSHGVPRVDDKRVLSGIIFINRNGLRWRDAPAEYDRRRRFITDGCDGADWACLPRCSQRWPPRTEYRDRYDRRHPSESTPIARQHMQGMCERGTASSLRGKKGGANALSGAPKAG